MSTLLQKRKEKCQAFILPEDWSNQLGSLTGLCLGLGSLTGLGLGLGSLTGLGLGLV